MRIGIVAPGRPIGEEVVARANALAAERFPATELVFHPQCFLSEGHFAGPDEVRAAAFVEYTNDPALDAIWFARGGYGANRILARAMPELDEVARTKTYLGYSDAGFLLAALYAAGIGRSAHGPLVSDVLRDDGGACAARALTWLTTRDPSPLEPHLDGRPAIAFNLAILSVLSGSRWLPDLTGHVLMIEDVAEPLYRIDRMLFQMAHVDALKGLAGVRLGRIGDVIDNDPPWTEEIGTMIERWCAEMGVPFLGPADIGHDGGNKVVPFGQPA